MPDASSFQGHVLLRNDRLRNRWTFRPSSCTMIVSSCRAMHEGWGKFIRDFLVAVARSIDLLRSIFLSIFFDLDLFGRHRLVLGGSLSPLCGLALLVVFLARWCSLRDTLARLWGSLRCRGSGRSASICAFELRLISLPQLQELLTEAPRVRSDQRQIGWGRLTDKPHWSRSHPSWTCSQRSLSTRPL